MKAAPIPAADSRNSSLTRSFGPDDLKMSPLLAFTWGDSAVRMNPRQQHGGDEHHLAHEAHRPEERQPRRFPLLAE